MPGIAEPICRLLLHPEVLKTMGSKSRGALTWTGGSSAIGMLWFGAYDFGCLGFIGLGVWSLRIWGLGPTILGLRA